MKKWLDGDNYEKAFKLGERLKRFVQDLPPEVKKSPSNTLYRCLAVGVKSIQNIRKGVPLTLKNRKYSSWTYDVEAAKNFGDQLSSESELQRKGLRVIILKKYFSDDKILLNVEKATQLFLTEGDYGYLDTAETEKEIIVENVQGEFKFSLENIYLYRVNGIWKAY